MRVLGEQGMRKALTALPPSVQDSCEAAKQDRAPNDRPRQVQKGTGRPGQVR